MLRLLVRTSDLLLRRLTRTAAHPRLRPAVYAVLVLGGCVASAAISVQNYVSAAAAEPTEQLFSGLISVAVSFVIVGPVVLAAEAARDRSGQFQATLASLPISGLRMHLLVWAPILGLVFVTTALLFPPAVASLVGARLALADAMSFAAVSMSLGVASAAASIVIVSVIFRGNRWSVVRAPLSYLVWATIAVVQVAAAIGILTGGDVPEWLLFPQVVGFLANGEHLGTPVAIAGFAVGLAAVAALLLLGEQNFRTINHGRVIVGWGRRARHGRLVGEVLYALRDPNVAANLFSSVLLSWGVLCLVYRLPAEGHHDALPWAISAILLCAGVVARGLRGAFPSRRTPQQMIGMNVRAWFATQTAISLGVLLLVGFPAVLLPGLGSATSIALLGALLLSSAASAVLTGWVLVVAHENSMGQFLATFAFLGMGASLNGITITLSSEPAVALAFASSVLIVSLLAAAAVERSRWTFRRARGRHRPR